MNLRDYAGRVPLFTDDPDLPIRLTDFPSWEEFEGLYGNRVSAENRARYYSMLKDRAAGATLTDAGRKAGVTKERVRQVEAKFLRLMRRAKLASEKPQR